MAEPSDCEKVRFLGGRSGVGHEQSTQVARRRRLCFISLTLRAASQPASGRVKQDVTRATRTNRQADKFGADKRRVRLLAFFGARRTGACTPANFRLMKRKLSLATRGTQGLAYNYMGGTSTARCQRRADESIKIFRQIVSHVDMRRAKNKSVHEAQLLMSASACPFQRARPFLPLVQR